MDAAAAQEVGDQDDAQPEPVDAGDVVEQQNMGAWVLPPDDERGSWEDSERFEEDSLCSWISEPESLCQNWRGWDTRNASSSQAALSYTGGIAASTSTAGALMSSTSRRSHSTSSKQVIHSLATLKELSARVSARHLSFNDLEESYHAVMVARNPDLRASTAVPGDCFLPIVRCCFPESEEDIRLYSCLASGNADEFQRGEGLYHRDAVKQVFQIGYHLSAIVVSQNGSIYNVAIRVDRCRIVSCSCTCATGASWCCHVVAVCLFRILKRDSVEYRMTVWESINELEADQLKKFAQNLINDLPRQYLPTAQRLLDQLRDPASKINTEEGAPDPTDGGHEEVAAWFLDERTLHDNIRKILVKFCVPSPTVFSDVHYLSSSQPPAANEWESLLRPLKNREPEGLWNLLSIVREMYRRHDENATTLLHIITEECLNTDQVMMWWYQTKLSQSGTWMLTTGAGSKSGLATNQHNTQYSCASLCDEIVAQWRIAALNPRLTSEERTQLNEHLWQYHRRAVERIWKLISAVSGGGAEPGANGAGPAQHPPTGLPSISGIVGPYGKLSTDTTRFRLDWFPGFKLGLEACLMDWSDANVEGIDFPFETPVATAANSNTANKLGSSVNEALSVTCVEGVSGIISVPSPRSRASNSPNMPILREKAHLQQRQLMQQKQRADESEGDAVILAASSVGARTQTPSAPAPLQAYNQHAGSMSPESGQESDGAVGGDSPGVGRQNQFFATTKQKKTKSGKAEAPPADDRLLSIYMPQSQPADQASSSARPPVEKEKEKEQYRSPLAELNDILESIQAPTDRFDVKFTRCEALHAHGYTRQAVRKAIELAEQLIASPPDLMIEVPPPKPAPPILTPTKAGAGGKKKKKPSSSGGQGGAGQEIPTVPDRLAIAVSQLASLTLQRAVFLFEVLCLDQRYHSLAFAVGLFALELPRQPSATKYLEVKLNHQESEIVALLKKRDLGYTEMQMVRACAKRLIDGAYRNSYVLPMALAHFVFDSLANVQSPPTRRSLAVPRQPGDDELGFEAALEALGIKPIVSEAEHPLLCEGTRRQRGDLSMALLLRYKDSPEKLARIMDRLLDPSMHQMYRTHASNAAYYDSKNLLQHHRPSPPSSSSSSQHGQLVAGSGPSISYQAASTSGLSAAQLKRSLSSVSQLPAMEEHGAVDCDAQVAADFEVAQLMDEIELADDPNDDQLADSPSLNARLSTHRQSADEGNESRDQSPRLLPASSDAASDSSGSGASRAAAQTASRISSARPSLSSIASTTTTSVAPSPAVIPPSASSAAPIVPSSSSSSLRTNRRKHLIPCMPNQASEAQAHHMNELAKKLLSAAGGNQSTAIFNVQHNVAQNNQPHGNSPHRGLQLCAFQIGLYALGLHNRVSPNWLSRTYSTHVSWLSGQATEIGRPAIRIVIETWENHLTPPEAANLADKASQVREPFMVQAAAELALSVLSKANALNPTEIQRAIDQCRDQGTEMLRRACYAVEKAAEKDGVYPEVLFKVARQWYELYDDPELRSQSQQQQQQQQGPPLPYQAACQDHGASGGAAAQLPNISQPPPSLMNQPSIVYAPQMSYPMHHPPGGYPPSMVYNAMYAGLPTSMYRPPALYMAPGHCQPMVLPYGYRQPVPNVPIRQQLHMSHSAPSLASMQAQFTRRHGHHHHGGAQQHIPELQGGPNQLQQQQQQQQLNQMSKMGPPQGADGINRQPQSSNTDPRLNCLVLAHRVGMKAMETMGTGSHDDNRSYVKYSQNPSYGDDVRWLLTISQKLGPLYAQHFFEMAARSVVSPFVLYDLACESFKLFPIAQQHYGGHHSAPILPPIARNSVNVYSNNNQAQGKQYQGSTPQPPHVFTTLTQHGWAHPTAELMQRCLEMFYAASNQKLSHPRFVASDLEEVIELVKKAKLAFQSIPMMPNLFDDFMKHVRRQKACKKDVLAKIMAAANGQDPNMRNH